MKHPFIILTLIISLLLVSCSRGKRASGRDRIRNTESVQSDIPRSKTTLQSSRSRTRTSSANTRELSGADIFDKYNSAVFTIFTSDGYNNFQGSGFFISSDGLAVSNYHVFKGTYKGFAQIKLANGSLCKINEIIAYNSNDDIFIFKVETSSKTFVPISNRKVRVGEKAYAIGSPQGLENTFSSGEISQLREGFIQISVPIDHGSSGGVLLNSYGEAIGITTAGYSGSSANLNFAVDIHVLEKYINLY